MNIYIFGNQDFKKDIHKELEHSNIKLKISDYGKIEDISSLQMLKELIENNTDNIFLIDDSKIIKENILNSKIKFLKPKDGIEKSFLIEHGIEDISVDSISDISKHIVKKMEDLGLYEEFIERDEIHDSISDIVQEAFQDNEEEEDPYELTDDLKPFLTNVEKDDETKSLYDDLDIKEFNYEPSFKMQESEEIIMTKEFLSLDDLTESDIQAALDGKMISSRDIVTNRDNSMSIKLDKPEDITALLAKLLDNKALEITVRLKD